MLVKLWKVMGIWLLPPLSHAITGAIYKIHADTIIILMSFIIGQTLSSLIKTHSSLILKLPSKNWKFRFGIGSLGSEEQRLSKVASRSL
jgi:hypothetical protein